MVTGAGLTRIGVMALCAAFAACATAPKMTLEALEQRVDDELATVQGLDAELTVYRAASGATSRAGSIDGAYYNMVGMRLSPLAPAAAKVVPKLLRTALLKGGVKRFEYLGPSGRVQFDAPFDSQSFEGVPLAVEYAASVGADSTLRGAESDVRVPFEDGSAQLVTIWNDGRGHVETAGGVGGLPAVASGSARADELRGRFGVGPIEGWSGRELGSLQRALELLDARELAVISGLPFRRRSDAPSYAPKPPENLVGSGAKACGLYRWDRGQRFIEMYDCAFAAESYGFVGSADRPLAPSVRTIVHEIGHALAKRQITDLLDRMLASYPEAKELADEFNRQRYVASHSELGHFRKMSEEITAISQILTRWNAAMTTGVGNTSPILADFDRVRGTTGFTAYGRWSSDEAFAEAFSLYRADPEACKRISPEASAFFAAGRHIPALQ